MKITPVRAALAAAATLAVTGCADYGYGGHGYGYSRVSVGYRSSYPYYGWYDDYYYPGVGIYVYDRGGHRHRWSDRHRRHWEARRGNHRRHENWSGYRGRGHGDRDRGHRRRYRD